MSKFIIKDWANNILFDDKEFNTFDDAWSHIMENDDDENLEDYHVEEL